MNKKIEQEIVIRRKKIEIIDIKIQKLRKEKKFYNDYIHQQYFRQRKKEVMLKESCN